MNEDVLKKTVLITGATRGLGKAMTEKFLKQGAKVIMVARNKKLGKAQEAEFKAKGYDVFLKIADMAKIRDIERLCSQVAKDHFRIDVLINNAAMILEDADSRISNLNMAIFEKTMNINFKGPLLMCKKLLPLLLKSQEGRIINISSSAGRLSGCRSVNYPAYSISKTSLNGLTKVLAYEMRDKGVMVFSVDPGWTRTELGGPQATYSVEEGIDTALYLATERSENLSSGSFYFLRRIIEW